ncbi:MULTISPECIES: MarR family winged helix-turn-helix transcriptional regulator [unclassified Streptomyces]|uniref:MarR family winged helix-turn-helix transcriptional regulator n=1 Tax=unclassified Streptomyces TaxID=2593676 RepID=UPI0032514997
MKASELSDELAGLLPRIQRLARRRLWSGVSAPRMRGAHAELLRLVVTEPGVRVSSAARSLSLAANSVSTLVNHLAAEGLLRREKDPGDGRAALLYPTPAGVEKLHEWHARRAALFRRHLAGLDADDRAALTAALPALHRLAASMREGDETA